MLSEPSDIGRQAPRDVAGACLPMSDGSDSISHRPIQRPAAIAETLPPSVQSPREILALCFSTFHNSACPKYTLSPIMSLFLRRAKRESTNGYQGRNRIAVHIDR